MKNYNDIKMNILKIKYKIYLNHLTLEVSNNIIRNYYVKQNVKKMY